jgi:monoamine oxidase
MGGAAQANIMADVLVLGGGVAGLAAAGVMARAGLAVELLEGRERLGGRVWSIQVPGAPAAIEQGAEFIHGRPPEIFDFVSAGVLPVVEVDGTIWRFERELVPMIETDLDPEAVLEHIDTGAPDRSFRDFLARLDVTAEEKAWATAFVEGFHAADANRISTHSLARSAAADRQIDGQLQYRPAHGYEALVTALASRLKEDSCAVHLGTNVREIRWQRGSVRVSAETLAGHREFSAACVLIALPLGVLQARRGDPACVAITPELGGAKGGALQWLNMGPVIRVSLLFREAFWVERMRDLTFLFSHERWFPTWWWAGPSHGPVLTGWAAGLRGLALSKRPAEEVIARGLETLERIFDRRAGSLGSLLVGGYTHDWQSDRFSRGAYSWASVGGSDAFAALAKPVDDTLYFAGEATDNTGHNGTVHGAIASGYRAAREILSVHRK